MSMAYIVIEGVIGVGKTALTRLLGERLGVSTFFEKFEENPFLSNFYSDRARYAFQTEVFFLLNRYRQQQSEVQPAVMSGNVVGDYLFAKTRLFAGINLAGDELALFEQIYDALNKQVARPDLVVYLQASLDSLMSRIYQRDRSFERNMDPRYIERLSGVYEQFFEGYSDTPVLKIETAHLDLIRDAKAQQRVIEAIVRGDLLPLST
ncbi:MAG: deoxynucleoside kinase [Chloroflexota bacterium]|nr:deoxynucleoside kinase [Chloroflexota bacterium]